MILFKKLFYKNFLSTGNNKTEIQLDRSPSTLIVGHNGAGKSTILDALSFGLFGKPHRDIKKAQLVNSVNNKAAEVEVEFSIGQHDFRIVRGIKPSKFEIYQNDRLLNQEATVRDYQMYLEKNILKLNHKSFHQVVVLGSSSFIPFMQLPNSHRREVIEDLLDIQVFGKMAQLLNERKVRVREDLKGVEYSLDMIKEKIQLTKKYIREVESLNANQTKEKKAEIDSYRKEIEELQFINSKLSVNLVDEIKEVNEILTHLNRKKSELEKYEHGIKSGINRVVQEAKFFETHDSCPTCAQSIEEEFKDFKLKNAKTKATELKEGMDKCNTEIEEATASIETASDKLTTLNSRQNKISINNVTISSLQGQVDKLEGEILKLTDTDSNLSESNRELQDLFDERDSSTERKLELLDKRSYYEVVGEMLKDTGIKTKIIKQYLPVMNKLINQYLQVMDFYVSFNLDESFQETIKSRYRDTFNYASFSEGEKMKIDLALLFTWRQVARMKNSAATNLLILDETFDSSLDNDGIENLLKILDTLEGGTNIFVISHRGDALDGKFRSKIVFEKVRNFSVIKP
jgi:DNA repair exonuclease SbcCD ATPase subunit